MDKFRKITLTTFNTRGYNLTPVELKDVVPFEVKRVYTLEGIQPGQQTGEHCHFEEKEIFMVVKGVVTAIIDKGDGKEEVELSGPGDAIYVANYVWHGFKNASADCVIVAFSSTNYNANRSDYLEDYSEYLTLRDQHLK